jgi:Protein of unknown function (DUF3800)
MYLLYLDDAGSSSNTDDKHIVLAGIALFERQVHFLQTALDELAQNIIMRLTEDRQREDVEFHAVNILNGRKFWHQFKPLAVRRKILTEALTITKKLRGEYALFGVVVEKAAIGETDPFEYAFEQICARFDMYLGRDYKQDLKAKRGLVVLDKSTRETRLQTLTREFRRDGHTWGKLRNFVDVPFFVDSEATRAIQYADMVAYALWRKFEKNDPAFYEVIETGFDAQGGIRHGLHIKQNAKPKAEI